MLVNYSKSFKINDIVKDPYNNKYVIKSFNTFNNQVCSLILVDNNNVEKEYSIYHFLPTEFDEAWFKIM